MRELLGTLFGLLRLRGGPQDLPASWSLTAVVIAFLIGEQILTAQALEGEQNVPRVLLAAALQFAAVGLLLRMRGKPERLSQTLLALAGTGILVGLLVFAFVAQADPNRNQPLLGLLWFLVFGWSLAVDANIYRHAMEIPLSQAVLVTVMILAVTYVVVEFTFR